MSALRQRATDLVRSYDQVLEQQILGQGSCLACEDEKLWMRVEGLLKDLDPREIHCLGLNPLRVMEESLEAAAASALSAAAYSRRGKARPGLQGLAKAFEVLEQAALNLYLGPWREEYKVIKMYSGTFTHYITPVLSMPQTEKLFGLLGYQPSPSRPEELCLRSPRVSPASLEDLLRLSCAFLVARCECRLLLSALGKHDGDAQWELSVVRERRRGHSLQVALDNTEMQCAFKQPAGLELIDGDVDIYREEQVNGGQKEELVNDDEDPSSSFRLFQDDAMLDAQRRRNGPPSPRLVPDIVKISSANRSASKTSYEKPKFDEVSSQQIELPGLDGGKSDANDRCSCLHAPPLRLRHCFDCNAFHDITCAYLTDCGVNHHKVDNAASLQETMKELGEKSPQSRNLRASDGLSSNRPITTSLVANDDASSENPVIQPIGYHCESAKVDPQLLCHTCNVFHSGPCVEGKLCLTAHKTSRLGKCSCGKYCSRKPLVLCHYCGNEYCSQCWYKNPFACICGQTFDLSTSV